MTACEQFQQWAREAAEEWDGQDSAELIHLLYLKTGDPVFFSSATETPSARTVRSLRDEIADLRETLERTRAQLRELRERRGVA